MIVGKVCRVNEEGAKAVALGGADRAREGVALRGSALRVRITAHGRRRGKVRAVDELARAIDAPAMRQRREDKSERKEEKHGFGERAARAMRKSAFRNESPTSA